MEVCSWRIFLRDMNFTGRNSDCKKPCLMGGLHTLWRWCQEQTIQHQDSCNSLIEVTSTVLFVYDLYAFVYACLWVPVTTAWRVLRLRMEDRTPIQRVAVSKSNKQSRTADKGWSSSWGVERGANNSSPWKQNVKKYSQARCFLWRQNNPEVKYSPTRISGGECY